MVLTAVKALRCGIAAVYNADISKLFRRLADLLEIEGANPFRVRAYRTAAQTVDDLPRSAAAMIAAGEEFKGLPGIGKDLAGEIKEICETGRLTVQEVQALTPPGARSSHVNSRSWAQARPHAARGLGDLDLGRTHASRITANDVTCSRPIAKKKAAVRRHRS